MLVGEYPARAGLLASTDSVQSLSHVTPVNSYQPGWLLGPPVTVTVLFGPSRPAMTAGISRSVTPLMPGSPASWMPFPLLSGQTRSPMIPRHAAASSGPAIPISSTAAIAIASFFANTLLMPVCQAVYRDSARRDRLALR
jgi:hypothetical protein